MWESALCFSLRLNFQAGSAARERDTPPCPSLGLSPLLLPLLFLSFLIRPRPLLLIPHFFPLHIPLTGRNPHCSRLPPSRHLAPAAAGNHMGAGEAERLITLTLGDQ